MSRGPWRGMLLSMKILMLPIPTHWPTHLPWWVGRPVGWRMFDAYPHATSSYIRLAFRVDLIAFFMPATRPPSPTHWPTHSPLWVGRPVGWMTNGCAPRDYYLACASGLHYPAFASGLHYPVFTIRMPTFNIQTTPS